MGSHLRSPQMTLKEGSLSANDNCQNTIFPQIYILICLPFKKVSGKIFTSCYNFERKHKFLQKSLF